MTDIKQNKFSNFIDKLLVICYNKFIVINELKHISKEEKLE